MRKVQLYFTLVGKSNAWERGLQKDEIARFTNKYRVEMIRDIVSNQFGNRAIIITNEDRLKNSISTYPKFYSAGWFVSQDDDESELVVVGHANTMEAATKTMLEAVKLVDWDEFSARIV